MNMAEQILRIIYPANLLSAPILNHLIRSYPDLTVNILRAEVGDQQGWLEIQLIGHPGLIENAQVWLQDQGVEVNRLGA